MTSPKDVTLGIKVIYQRGGRKGGKGGRGEHSFAAMFPLRTIDVAHNGVKKIKDKINLRCN